MEQDNQNFYPDDKIRGMIYAVCLGDALGLPFEFYFSKHNRYTGRLIDNRLERKNRWGNHTILDYGQISDDGEMTIIMLNHIKKYDNIELDKLVLDYLCWANNPTSCCMGKNTSLLFKGIKTYNGYKNRYKNIDPNNQSNGHLMRASPLSLLDDEDLWDKECMITNPHPTCIFINRLYINMIKKCLSGIDKQIIISEALNKCSNSNILDIQEVFGQIKTNTLRDTSKQKGWVVHSLYCVLYCFIHFNTIEEVMEWIINQKGDTDTNGAIVCGIFGAYMGYNKLYEQQADNIDVLRKCDTHGGNKVRPSEYRVSYIDEILKS